MRILRLYTRIPPLLGGMENHIKQLTIEQAKLGHNVSIYFNKGINVTDTDIQITKIPLYKIKPQFIGIFIFYFLVLIRLFLNKKKFDIVHIHGDWSSIVFSNLIKKIVDANKILITIHDQLSENFIKKKLLALSLIPVDTIISTGYKSALQVSRLTNKKIALLTSGINKIFFEEYDRKFYHDQIQVLTVANLVKKKNLGLVLDIAKHKPSMNFVIVGDGKEKSILNYRIKSESITNVKLLGFQSSKELKLLYHKSDIFLFTSLKEGTPTVILEAMACGLPIISSNAGEIKPLIEHNFIVEKVTKQEFLNCLTSLSDNLELRKKISDQNIVLSRDFTWERLANNIESFIQK